MKSYFTDNCRQITANLEKSKIQSQDPTLAFQNLDPNQILDAIDSAGHWRTDGRVSALNSYENRVYSIGLEDGSSIIAKFYRPARWTDEAIIEEHRFCAELCEREIPVIAPLSNPDGDTLMFAEPFRFCLFPRAGGRAPELDNAEQLGVIGRTLARIHLIGEIFPFQHRPYISPQRFGDDAVDSLLDSSVMPAEHAIIYESLVDDLLPEIHARFDELANTRMISVHGDFHPGNILWGSDDTPHVLDFDDTATGPSIQDLWMFISGDRPYAQARLGDLLDGYFEFREFDERELELIEPLRTLRILNYAAWIAHRWDDPAFKLAFPQFASERFWDEHILSLREQRAALDEPALRY